MESPEGHSWLSREELVDSLIAEFTLVLIEDGDVAIRVREDSWPDDDYGVWLSKKLVAYEIWPSGEVTLIAPRWYAKKMGLAG